MQSTTYTTPGKVIDDSAILVDTIIFLVLYGASLNTSIYYSNDKLAYRGNSFILYYYFLLIKCAYSINSFMNALISS